MTTTVKVEKTKWSMTRTFQTSCLQRESPSLSPVPAAAILLLKEDFTEKTLCYQHTPHNTSTICIPGPFKLPKNLPFVQFYEHVLMQFKTGGKRSVMG